MIETQSIEVVLPDEFAASAEDLEVLRTTFQTIVTMARECGGAPCRHLERMRDDGWEVNWGLTWIAKAKRGGVYEESTGPTKEEALSRLRQHTRLHEADGCP